MDYIRRICLNLIYTFRFLSVAICLGLGTLVYDIITPLCKHDITKVKINEYRDISNVI